MGKRIVIALGGNALGSNLPEQMIAVKQTAKAIVDLIEEGHEVIIPSAQIQAGCPMQTGLRNGKGMSGGKSVKFRVF